tara:strand:- start:410 stop:637 length:228 start_codon:yes stop_codon:yes gene_type:complete
MNIKELIKKFKQEFSLSEIHECQINQDDSGKTLDVTVPYYEAKDMRKKLPRRWNKLRVLVMYVPFEEHNEDEWTL